MFVGKFLSLIITILAFIISVFWFYAAYLRKSNSEKLNGGLLALPSFFSFNVLIFAGIISTIIFFIRVVSSVSL